MVIAGPRPVSGATVTVVGAGAVARSTALALAAHGARRFVVTSRSAESRESLAAALRARGPGCETRSWSALRSAVSAADIVVCATGAPGRVLAADCLPRGRPLIVLDLASPRDVDPAVAMVPGMRLIDLDSIWREARRSHDVPPGEVLKARAIVAGMTDDFMRWLAERHAASVITALRARGDQSSADGLGRGRRLHQQTLALKDIARATAARRGEWTST
jgi:glutamyl-tRNA reductase